MSGKPTRVALPLGRFHLRQRDSRAPIPVMPPQLRHSHKPKRLKTSQPFVWFASAFAGSCNNDLEELASRARVHSRINLHKQDGSRVATKRHEHLQGLQQGNKGQTYCSYEERNPSTTAARGTGRDNNTH